MSEAAVHTWRRVLVLVVLVSLAVGCGAKKSVLDGSADAMKDAGSSRVEMKMAPATPLPAYTATGAMDYAHNRGELVMTSPSNPKEFPGGEMNVRFFGDTTYIGFAIDGKLRWLKETDEPTGTDRFIPGIGGTSPDRLLDSLVKSSKKVEILGSENVRDVSAKHYRAHLDTKKLGEDFSYNGEEAVIDVWIDADGLARRLHVPEEGAGPLVFDFYDFGAEVDVEAPPAEDVYSEKEFNKLIEKECLAMRGEKPPSESGFFCAYGVGEVSEEEAPTEITPRTITEPPPR